MRVREVSELASLLPSAEVVGASIAVGSPSGIDVAAWGETRFGTGQRMTPRTVLQIGSITKLYTATLVMQLVQEGRIALEERYRSYVPEFEPKDSALADQITVSSLLSHTSGLQNDFVVDTGRGDDCLLRFVDECATIEQGPVGVVYDYCNAGYVLLGRLVEKVTGHTWDAALASRILEPAALAQTVTLPEAVLLHENAAGHFPHEVDGLSTWVTAPSWSVPRVAGPAGTICATASDVVRFAAHHTLDAPPLLLRPETRGLMQAPRARIEGSRISERCGLGWHLRAVADREVIGHTGGNMGQGGLLWVDLARARIVCLLVNGVRDMNYLERVLEAVTA